MSPCNHSHPPGDTSCKEAYELLFDYLEGGLPEETREAVKAHFQVCPPCLEFLESYQKTPKLCREALQAKMPEELTSQLKSFLRKKLSGG